MSDPSLLPTAAELARLEGLELRARRSVDGHLTGRHRSPRRGISVEFTEHRDYSPGDDLRHVDWKVWGKRDRLYLKQFEEETSLACHLLVDASESMTYRSPAAAMSKWEYATRLAAMTAWLVLRRQDSVGVTLFDEQIRGTLRPASRKEHLRQVLQLLESTVPGGRSRLGECLPRAAGQIARRGLVIVISDFFDDPAAVREGLRQLVFRGHDVGVLQVIDPAEQDFAFDEPLQFDGLKRLGREAIEPRGLRRAYCAEFEAFLRSTRDTCREAAIDYRLTRTDEPPVAALAGFLAGRRR